MIRIVVDFYMAPDDAFYVHIEEPDRDPSIRRDPFFAQAEWMYAAKITKRLRKHLKRVGYVDRQNIDAEAARELKLPDKFDPDYTVGFPVKPDGRKAKW